jgi:hypothetical protein
LDQSFKVSKLSLFYYAHFKMLSKPRIGELENWRIGIGELELENWRIGFCKKNPGKKFGLF